jgi:hypothetical protein
VRSPTQGARSRIRSKGAKIANRYPALPDPRVFASGFPAASCKGPANASASLNDSRSLNIPAVNTMKAAVRFVGNLEAEAAEVFTLSPSFPVQLVERCRDAHAVSLASYSSQP